MSFLLGRWHVLLLCVCGAQVLVAAETTPLPLATVASDGSPTNATVTISLSADGGASHVDAVPVATDAAITAVIAPDPAHGGNPADIFVLLRIGNRFTVKNPDGVFEPWNLTISGLLPYRENVVLTEGFTVDIFSGPMNTPGIHRVYVGYLPAGGSGIVFNPVAARFTVEAQTISAFGFFEENIAENMLATRCVVCHVKGGVADGETSLLYERDPDLTQANFDIFAEFFDTTDNAFEYILSKASGGDDHTGGNQLPVGSSDYLLMEQFLTLLSGNAVNTASDGDDDFFSGVILQSNRKTLRRAAILLAGRTPTVAELRAVSDGNDDELRRILKFYMRGDNFHEFLKDAANDRLLVRGLGLDARIIRECIECYPAFANALYAAEKQRIEEDMSYTEQALNRQVDKAMIESPLELIAYVVENNRPYSEILTADYMMFNPLLNDMLGGTAVFDDPTNNADYRPGKLEGMWLLHDSMVRSREEGIVANRVDDPGELHTLLPHAGILTSRAFLTRYPTTATNRNRARARWTYYHFLDIDIEGSAQRTTDPDALADTDNPTMNNPNCTICHERLDPVAGTFQNYAPQGQYRVSYNGLDSLDPFYKYPVGEESLYREGDTWYRDMRDPGYLQKKAPNSDNSLQWLAGEIVRAPGFLSATVKFWWPAVIGNEVVLAPEVTTDADYRARLLAYEAQQDTVASLAETLRGSGLNLKDMLVEMIMSPWFRTQSINYSGLSATEVLAHEITALGNEKLLTPKQLQRKTTTLTGYTWLNLFNLFDNEEYTTAMGRLYGQYYGGIDSNAVTVRTRMMTPMMGTVPLVHALEVSCPVVLREFILPDEDRLLFGGMNEDMTPETDEDAIRRKLVELHEILLGKTYAADSPEINEAYGLFVDSRNERRNSDIEASLFNDVDYCPWGGDINIGKGLGFGEDYIQVNYQQDGKPVMNYHGDFLPWLGERAADPNYTKQAWRTVLVYLLSHYDYLYE